LLHVTSRVEGEAHPKLLEQKGGLGFPHLVFMDAEGEVVATHEGALSVEGFAETAKDAKGYLDVQTKAAAGDRAAKIDLALLKVEAGKRGLEDAKKELAALGELTEAQKKRLDGLELSPWIEEILNQTTVEKATQVESGRRFAEWAAQGREPVRRNDVANFWSLILVYAEANKDAATYQKALGKLRERFGSNKKFFETKEKILEDLKAKKP
jgi:hypothetical protein